MKNILLCTLGASWAVIPEVYGFLAPSRLPLYQNHPKREQMESWRKIYRLQPPDEIWICTTQGEQTLTSLDCLTEWLKLLSDPPLVRIWQAGGTDQLATQQECADIRELILRACLAAQHRLDGGQLLLSLAGGRKTMSADVQWAGSLFGCQALIHVIGKEPLHPQLKMSMPELFTKPLPVDLCGYIFPLVTGQTTRSEYLDVSLDGRGPISCRDFPLPEPASGKIQVWTATADRLETELKNREKAGSQLLGNYLFSISQAEHHENWRSLYRLPPRVIERLRKMSVSQADREMLRQIPKAELHCHVGGCLNITAQREVGFAIWESLSETERRNALNCMEPLLENERWEWSWPDVLKQPGKRAHNAAAVLVEASDVQLQTNLFDVTEPRIALKTSHPFGFNAYERPGELSGSALLIHPAAIEPYAGRIAEQAFADGLAYVELRGSPQKYGDGLDFLERFRAALLKAAASLPNATKPLFRFIIIGDRRQPDILNDTIKMAVLAKERWPDFIVGLDLAGDESTARPEEVAPLFLPVFEACMPLTIHAGEGEDAASIWQAAYHLHADRIGHGLTIGGHPLLAERFRNRDICLELCPTSNREVVGYRDPDIAETADCAEYPLQKLWEQGLPLTLCTDNPGISRTTLTDEYLTAARMMNGELSVWDALAMIKQGFVHAFLPGKDKETLLKGVDQSIYQLLLRIYDSER